MLSRSPHLMPPGELNVDDPTGIQASGRVQDVSLKGKKESHPGSGGSLRLWEREPAWK